MKRSRSSCTQGGKAFLAPANLYLILVVFFAQSVLLFFAQSVSFSGMSLKTLCV